MKNHKIIITIVIIITMISGGFHFWQMQKLTECESTLTTTEEYMNAKNVAYRNQNDLLNNTLDAHQDSKSQVDDLKNDLKDCQKRLDEESKTYIKTTIPRKKMGIYGLIYLEYPVTWSGLKVSERFGTDELLGLPTISIAQDNVAFGDFNWSQIDFYFAVSDITQKSLEYYEENDYQIQSTTIGGIQAHFIEFPLDNGKVTKGGTGGKMYFISLPGSMKTLVIEKQAKGNAEFEEEFENIINSIEFTN